MYPEVVRELETYTKTTPENDFYYFSRKGLIIFMDYYVRQFKEKRTPPSVMRKAMVAAAEGGKMGAVEFLISKGVNHWYHGLEEAIKGNHLDLIHFFIEKLMRKFESVEKIYNNGFQYAAQYGRENLIQFFTQGRQVNWNYGLIGAAQGRHLNLVNTYINNGASVVEIGMAHAARGGHLLLVKHFIDLGAFNWDAAMENAEVAGHEECYQYLFKMKYP